MAAQLSWQNWCNLGAYIVNFVITYASLTGVFGATNTDLSAKYQTLVTPAGFAFAIWGPIFIWEGVFAVTQMLPNYRESSVVPAVTPWWLAACLFQVLWTLAFAQEIIPLALACMLGILVSLLGLAWATDSLKMSCAEYGLLRAPLSLHLGWIIAASAVNISVQADYEKASPGVLGGLAIASYGLICVFTTVFAAAAQSPDPIVCLVAAWAFNGIRAELADPKNLDNPDRHNPYMWDPVTLSSLENAASLLTALFLASALYATVMKVRGRSVDAREVTTPLMAS